MRYRTAIVPVLAALALAGCGGGADRAAAKSSGASTHTLTVNFELHDTDNVSCSRGGHGGYSDITPDTDVTVYDGSGKVIATAPLGRDCHFAQVNGQDLHSDATWTTQVRNVPDASFYQVEVGHRGKLTFSKSDLNSKGWSVHASLGVGS